MGWIDRQNEEPKPNVRILVWGEEWPEGVIAADWDYETWVDAVDHVDVSFRYWKPAPVSPYNGRNEAAGPQYIIKTPR
jgi:hypothetical protein